MQRVSLERTLDVSSMERIVFLGSAGEANTNGSLKRIASLTVCIFSMYRGRAKLEVKNDLQVFCRWIERAAQVAHTMTCLGDKFEILLGVSINSDHTCTQMLNSVMISKKN